MTDLTRERLAELAASLRGLATAMEIDGGFRELARVLESLSYGSDTTSRDAHSIIVALLAERDGLKTELEAERKLRGILSGLWDAAETEAEKLTAENSDLASRALPLGEYRAMTKGTFDRALETLAAADARGEKAEAALSASNAALADALGLLRALTTDQDIGEGPAYDVISTPQMRGDVLAARAFLAKHGPSP